MRPFILSKMILLLTLVLLGGSLTPVPAEATQPSDIPLLARIEVEGPLEAIQMPVFAHLQDADGRDYALVVASPGKLAAGRYRFDILDYPPKGLTPENYLIALERKKGSRAAAARMLDVLHDDGRHLILRATREEAEIMAGLGFEIAWLPAEPLVLSRPVTTVAKTITSHDEKVAEQINLVTATDVAAYCGNLSGENTVIIGEESVKIASRYTYADSWHDLYTRYAHDFLQSQALDVSYHYWQGTKRNVIGEKAGGDHAEEIVLVTAHLDCMPSGATAPGADDNASGSAGVMTAAAIMKDFLFERTIRFVFFTGEEQGLLGSKKYAQKVADDDENIVAVLNMDMIGWDDIGEPVLRLHTRTGYNPGYEGDKAIADQFINVVDLYGLGDALKPIIDPDGITASDHASFWSKGYAGILAIQDDVNDFNDYYHTVNDTLDKLNLTYFTNFIKASVGTAAHLAIPANPLLTADFSFSNDKFKIVFTDESTCEDCEIVEWAWDYGDGKSSEEQHPNHTYTGDGTFTVSLTITADNGQTATAFKEVFVQGYCASSALDQNYEWIAGVRGWKYPSSYSGPSSYSDFTNKTFRANSGKATIIRLKPGFADRSFQEKWRVWADLNRDGDFDDAGEKLVEKTSDKEIYTSFTIPKSVKTGKTRMRVSMSWGEYPSSCGEFDYGEVEDYSLYIMPILTTPKQEPIPYPMPKEMM